MRLSTVWTKLSVRSAKVEFSALPADSVVRANCQRAGVPANFQQLGNTILTTTGGNPALEPEDARTFTAGFVWTPGFVPGLTLTADYFRIRTNEIRMLRWTQPASFPIDRRHAVGLEIGCGFGFQSSLLTAYCEQVAAVDMPAIYEGYVSARRRSSSGGAW